MTKEYPGDTGVLFLVAKVRHYSKEEGTWTCSDDDVLVEEFIKNKEVKTNG